MNGWAKIAGAFSLIAGIVYLVGVILAVTGGLDIGNAQLSDFAADNKFKYAAILASVLFAYSGACSVFNASTRNPTSGVFGIIYIAASVTLLVSAVKADVSRISWEFMLAFLAGIIIATCVFFAAHAVKNGKYVVADISLIFILGVFVAYLYDTKMIGVLVDVLVLMMLGILGIVCGGDDYEEVVARLHTPAPRVVVPASAPVPANPPIAKEQPVEAATAVAAEEPAKAVPAKVAEKKPVEAAPAKAVEEPAKAAEAPKEAEKPVEAAPAKEQPVEAATAVAAEEPVEEAPAEVIAKGWEVAAAKVGEDKACEMSDPEILEVIKNEDPKTYAEILAYLGIATAPAEEPVEEAPAEVIAKGWEVAAAKVGEDKACEMSDPEILEVIKNEDPKTYAEILAYLGIATAVVSEEPAEEPAEESVEEPETPVIEMTDEELGLIPDSPSGFVRRACWNKGLRCRKDYGSYYIPFAFVKSKVAVYVDGEVADDRNDDKLKEEGWVVLHFKESEITDGSKQAEIINDAVKENLRSLKKAKAKAKKKR